MGVSLPSLYPQRQSIDSISRVCKRLHGKLGNGNSRGVLSVGTLSFDLRIPTYLPSGVAALLVKDCSEKKMDVEMKKASVQLPIHVKRTMR